ncbi:hypothetical protein [Acidovorax cavernicola]|uniref:Uncharacterized protein n=1 Tax=Acidovorax cavernicola TaxID=1675792 RepID=A0A9X8GU80_9BURK|nr:hypothetical protein [Acidovorax cavernicola]RIX76775.1 hypothetical protein D3H34_21085 [Acidovorax cavernicola]
MKWIVAGFVALVFAVLSFNAFIANDLSRQRSGNRLIGMLTDLYGWLMGTIGSVPSGLLFAACAVGIVVLAVRDGRKTD